MAVQPLLELVDHQQHLAVSTGTGHPQLGTGCRQVDVGGQMRQVLAKLLEQPHFRVGGGGFDKDRQYLVAEPGQQPRFHQRRLAATGRAVDQAHGKRLVRIGLLDAVLPEADALGQSVAITRARQEFQKEVRILGIKRPQALWE